MNNSYRSYIVISATSLQGFRNFDCCCCGCCCCCCFTFSYRHWERTWVWISEAAVHTLTWHVMQIYRTVWHLPFNCKSFCYDCYNFIKTLTQAAETDAWRHVNLQILTKYLHLLLCCHFFAITCRTRTQKHFLKEPLFFLQTPHNTLVKPTPNNIVK